MITYRDCYERVLGAKGQGQGEIIRFKCPFPGCIGYDKKAFCVNVSNGTWCCHHCNQERPDSNYKDGSSGRHGGTAGEFAQMMNDDPDLWPAGPIDVSQQIKISPLTAKKRREVFTFLFSQCRLSESHQGAIERRGIDPFEAGLVTAESDLLAKLIDKLDEDTLIRSGMAYRDRQGQWVSRYCISPGRILIPYYDGAEVYFFAGYMRCPKRRPDQDIEEYQALREGWPKVAGPAGYTPAIYGDIPDEASLLIVTEGQFKAIAAIQKGFACVGLQGIMSTHANLVKQCVSKQVRRVVIIFDSQAEDQDNVDWACDKLGRELLAAGIPAYKAVLPLDPEVDKGQKMDIDSYLLHQGVSKFVDIIKGARPYFLRADDKEDEDEESEE